MRSQVCCFNFANYSQRKGTQKKTTQCSLVNVFMTNVLFNEIKNVINEFL